MKLRSPQTWIRISEYLARPNLIFILICVAWLVACRFQQGNQLPAKPTTAVTFVSTRTIDQPVNQSGFDGEPRGSRTEKATFEFTVRNPPNGFKESLVSAALIVDDFECLAVNASTAAYFPTIPHTGHSSVMLEDLSVDDAVPIPLSLQILPDSQRKFTIWLRNATKKGILRLTGRVRLAFENGSITSGPFEAEIH